jgi:hypothetical protein
MTHDLVRDGPAREGNVEHLAARRLDGLAHGFADLIRLPGGDADASLPVPDGDEGVETEAPTALDHLGHTVDRDDVFEQPVAFALALAAVTALPAAPTAATTSSATTTAAPSTTAATGPMRPLARATGPRRLCRGRFGDRRRCLFLIVAH